MKIRSKLTVLSSVAVLAASPLAFGHKGGVVAIAAEAPAASDGDTCTDPEICPEHPDVVVDETDGSATVDESTDGTDVEPDGGETVDTVADDGDAVPIDWVKRDGGVNPEIMQFSGAVGGTPGVKNEASGITKELGQDEKGSAIDARDKAAGPQISREKKGPVALIKKGRVFLR